MLLFEISEQKKIDIFIIIFTNMKLYTDIMTLILDDEKIIIQGMDISRVLLYDFQFEKDWFNEYNISNKLQFALKSETVENILKFYSKGQKIRFLSDENNISIVKFEFINIDKNSKELNKYFELGKNEFNDALLDIPLITYDSILKIDIKKFKSLINDLSKMGKKIIFNCMKEKCSISTLGVLIDIEKTQIDNYILLSNEPVNLTFSLSLLINICKLEKLSDTINIKLNQLTPLLIEYNIGEEDDEINEQLKFKFYLAPYEDNEDN
jgi:proliferating cell nuclear antigen PCNA